MKPLPKKITIGEKYRPAMKIEDQAEADAYFELCVQHTMTYGAAHEEAESVPREEAESIERQNLGYYAGYYSCETGERVGRLFKTQHPIFGKSTPTPKEAFDAVPQCEERVSWVFRGALQISPSPG
jgi:hypothetical protein